MGALKGVAAVAMLVVGCIGPSATMTPAASTTTAPSPAASALPMAPSGYAELDQALTTEAFKGRTVSLQSPWIGDDGVSFAAAVADFAARSGITIEIDSIGSSHEDVLRLRVTGKQAPDLAMLARPTTILSYGKEASLVEVATFMDLNKLRDEHAATIGLLTDADGHIWGVPYKADVKSTVWYPIRYFDEMGFRVPRTWDELIALSDSIKADGVAPWCIGMEAGTQTGRQFADWVEEVMLRTEPPEVYGDWVSHVLPFHSPEVGAAFEKVGQVMFTQGYVFGGNTAIMTTPEAWAFDPAFPADGSWSGFKPGCAMLKIPPWYGPEFFPDVRANGAGTVTKYTLGEQVGIFVLPGINDAQPAPVLGTVDSVVVFEDRPEVRAVAEFLATPQGIQRWIEDGNAVSANQSTPAEWYRHNYRLDVASRILNGASYIGFDASELMPPEVGSGTFLTEAVTYVNTNGANLDQVLENIDATTVAPEHKFGNW